MDSFVVSALKYRPTSFDEVVGQEAITDTLKNAIAGNQLAHAYLFCGPRGVGKTTCARIFAKVINSNGENNAEPDFSFNIFELDAASNNSVEDIRSLTDQVRIPPQTGNYKVYIIDEVHMLSQAAFNAFLKTLEEPPPHAIFILATTEKHKIIPTILSRCQIFDFNRITVSDIATHLQKISELENIPAEPEAIHVIAQKADGALRDALSMLDQLISFTGKNLTYQAVIKNLNVLDHDYYFKVTECVLSCDIPKCLLILDEILSKGFDGHNFVAGLASHFRNLLVCKDDSTVQLLEVGKNVADRYTEQSAGCNQKLLLRGLKLLNNCDVQYRNSKNQRLLVELTLMQLCSLNQSEEKKTPDETDGHIAIKPPDSPSTTHTPTSLESPEQKIETESTAAIPANRQKIVKEAMGQQENVKEPAEAVYEENANQSPEKTTDTEPVVVKRKTSTISIKDTLNLAPENEVIIESLPATSSEKSEDFTKEQFIGKWNTYAQKLKSRGKDSLFITLTTRMPELLEDYQIRLKIDNKAQLNDLNREKMNLLQFLREELKNDAIDIKPQVIERQEEKKLYTSREKYDHMAKKNPSLEILKKKLDLDIDY